MCIDDYYYYCYWKKRIDILRILKKTLIAFSTNLTYKMRIILFNYYIHLMNKTMPKKTTTTTTRMALARHAPLSLSFFRSQSVSLDCIYLNNENIFHQAEMHTLRGKCISRGKYVYMYVFNSQFTCREAVETFIKPKWISQCTYISLNILGFMKRMVKKTERENECERGREHESETERHSKWIFNRHCFQLYVLLLTKPWNNASLICWELPNGKCMLFAKSFASYTLGKLCSIQHTIFYTIHQNINIRTNIWILSLVYLFPYTLHNDSMINNLWSLLWLTACLPACQVLRFQKELMRIIIFE